MFKEEIEINLVKDIYFMKYFIASALRLEKLLCRFFFIYEIKNIINILYSYRDILYISPSITVYFVIIYKIIIYFVITNFIISRFFI